LGAKLAETHLPRLHAERIVEAGFWSAFPCCSTSLKARFPATFETATNHDKMTGMAASPYVKALDDIQKALTGFLKPVGFKKKGRTYNRHVGDGLVQVVNLQMGQFPIGDYVIPGLRESHYGRFTVNLGVALQAVRAIESGRELVWLLTKTRGLT